MKAWLVATLILTQISAASAQTPPSEETQPAAAAAPAPCSALPTEPAAINTATATTAQMSAASERQARWREQASEAIECRRLYYNAGIAQFNEVNSAWSAQLDAFCARRDIRCSERDRPQPPAQ